MASARGFRAAAVHSFLWFSCLPCAASIQTESEPFVRQIQRHREKHHSRRKGTDRGQRVLLYCHRTGPVVKRGHNGSGLRGRITAQRYDSQENMDPSAHAVTQAVFRVRCTHCPMQVRASCRLRTGGCDASHRRFCGADKESAHHIMPI